MSRRRSPHRQVVSTVIFSFALLWSLLLALVAVGGAFWLAIMLSVLGGVGLAWLHENV